MDGGFGDGSNPAIPEAALQFYVEARMSAT